MNFTLFSKFATNVYENYSRPRDFYFDKIQVSLDHNVPIKRGERVLMGALMNIKELSAKGACEAYAETVSEGGVTYTLRYPVEDMIQWRLRRHQVLEAVSSTLHKSGLKVSETIGEYALSRAPAEFHLFDLQSRMDVLKNVEMFNALNEKEIKSLANSLVEYEFDADDNMRNNVHAITKLAPKLLCNSCALS